MANRALLDLPQEPLLQSVEHREGMPWLSDDPTAAELAAFLRWRLSFLPERDPLAARIDVMLEEIDGRLVLLEGPGVDPFARADARRVLLATRTVLVQQKRDLVGRGARAQMMADLAELERTAS